MHLGHFILHCFAFARSFCPADAAFFLASSCFLTCFCLDWCFIRPRAILNSGVPLPYACVGLRRMS